MAGREEGKNTMAVNRVKKLLLAGLFLLRGISSEENRFHHFSVENFTRTSERERSSSENFSREECLRESIRDLSLSSSSLCLEIDDAFEEKTYLYS